MPRKLKNRKTAAGPGNPATLRIVGGRFRGQKILYGGHSRTRPMKNRLREALFNLIGPAVVDKQAIDLFSGTGALGLEALSRGACRATMIEQHFPTAETIKKNAATLGVEEATHIVTANVFTWWKRRPSLGPKPWLVFCSPPYELYVDGTEQMTSLIAELAAAAPKESILVVEADERFDFTRVFDHAAWDIRSYPPAVVGIYWKAES